MGKQRAISSDVAAEITEINMDYLLLAQRIIGNSERKTAEYVLGIDSETADIIASLRTQDIMTLSRSNQMLMRLDGGVARMLNETLDERRGLGKSGLHSAIAMLTASLREKEASQAMGDSEQDNRKAG